MMAPVGLPETVHVRISSEDAGYISFAPVVARDIPARELVESMLGIAGRDAARIAELLARGSIVSGPSRMRWEGFRASPEDVAALLETLPGPDPTRPFDPSQAVSAVLRGPGMSIEIGREAGSRRRAFHRRSFWDALLEAAVPEQARYADYSYKDRADRFTVPLSSDAAARLRNSANLLSYSAIEGALRRTPVHDIEFLVPR